jgi:hypothetical protein
MGGNGGINHDHMMKNALILVALAPNTFYQAVAF